MIPFGALLAGHWRRRIAAIDRIPRLRTWPRAGLARTCSRGAGYAGWIAWSLNSALHNPVQSIAAGGVLLGLAVVARRMRHGEALW